MNTQPIVVYVDDEPQNLVNFELAMPEDWSVHVFDNPLLAADKIAELQPWVVVTDQRMPGMNGVQFLEFVNKISPQTEKIITTGYSDENLIIESIRTAQVLDYITKPWNPDELPHRVGKAVDLFKMKSERFLMANQLEAQKQELEKTNASLNQALNEISNLARNEEKLRKELECWVPPVVLWATQEQVQFPLHQPLSLMAIDIVDSGELHGQKIGSHTLRQKALTEFSMLVTKHGGYVENYEGDAAYANFGLLKTTERACDAAFAVANEFRAALLGLSNHHGCQIECGIGLHYCQNVRASVNEYSVTTPDGIVTQKNFSTESTGIDLVHRIEKLTHKLEGSNIIMTNEFIENLSRPEIVRNIRELGMHNLKGQSQPAELYLIPSNYVTDEQLEQLIQKPAASAA